MKRRITWLMSILLLLQLFSWTAFGETGAADPETTAAATAAPVIGSASAVLMDEKTGKVLFEKEMGLKTHPASLTKIMTAMLVLENLGADESITVGSELSFLESDSGKAGLKKGQQLTAHDLVWALMLPNGNDAAYTAAVNVARKKSGNAAMKDDEAVAYFLDMMNARAKQIGANDSHFANPDGYPNTEHYSTAHDMALISIEAMKNDFFRETAGTYTYIRDESKKPKKVTPDKDSEYVWFNKNLLINPQSKYYFDHATGIRTGYTLKAGYCLAASAASGDLSLIAIVLKAGSDGARYAETRAMFDYGFGNYKTRQLLTKGEIVYTANVVRKYFGGTITTNLLAASDAAELLSEAEYAGIEKSYIWEPSILAEQKAEKAEISFIGPIHKDQVVGTVRFTLNGETVAESKLLASADVMTGSFTDSMVKLLDFALRYQYWLIGFFVALLALVTVLIWLKGRKKE